MLMHHAVDRILGVKNQYQLMACRKGVALGVQIYAVIVELARLQRDAGPGSLRLVSGIRVAEVDISAGDDFSGISFLAASTV